jgi:hypothetical protein
MNVITFAGTTAQNVGTSPFIRGKQGVIVNLSGASVTPQVTVDGTTWTALGSAVATARIVPVTIPPDARAVRLSAAGEAFLIVGV